MKQVEKLNVILNTLWKENGRSTMEEISKAQSLHLGSEELHLLAERLKTDGYIEAKVTKCCTFIKITSYGIEYCEENLSFTKNSLTSSIINISNSKNFNIISESSHFQNTSMILNSSEVEEKIEEIREKVRQQSENSSKQLATVERNLEELKISLKNGANPKPAFGKILESTANISTVTSLVAQLGELVLNF